MGNPIKRKHFRKLAYKLEEKSKQDQEIVHPVKIEVKEQNTFTESNAVVTEDVKQEEVKVEEQKNKKKNSKVDN